MGSRAGLTVSSVMVAGGEPGRLLALIDPDSSLRDVLEETGRGVVHLLRWEHRDLAEAFAGQMPAPGGPFTTGEWEQTEHGPRLVTALSWATVETESFSSVRLVRPGRRTHGGRGASARTTAPWSTAEAATSAPGTALSRCSPSFRRTPLGASSTPSTVSR